MEQLTYNLWSFIVQIITACAAVVFALWQININRRLKKLQDYCAVSIVPMGTNDLRLQIINVGKINLYLQKYEIGTNHEAYAKPMLIPAGSNSFLIVPIKNFNIGQSMDIKLYLIDELEEKFISTGEAVVNEINVQTGDSTQKIKQVTGWAYKTIKENWKL